MVVKDKIAREDIQPPFVKAAADVKKELVAIGCELHSDCAEELISAGSDSCDIWGFNIYTDGHIDFISLLNIRPAEDNRSMDIKSPEIRDKITEIVVKLLDLKL